MSTYTVAVTGAAGRVGISVVEHLLKAGYKVHALVHSQPSREHPIYQERVTVTAMNLALLSEQDVLNWFNAVRPSALIHSAAMVDVGGCERQPARAYFMNAQVTRLLAKACSRYNTHFVMLSTDYVFAGTSHPQKLYFEDDPTYPLNHYGKSKLYGEIATKEECIENLWTICRTSVIYGSSPWNQPDFMQWVRTILRQNKTIRIVTDQINSPTFSVDLAKMLVAIVEQRLHGIYHTAGCTPVDRYHFALTIAQLYGLDERLIQPVLTSELGLNFQWPLNAGLCVDKIRRDAGIRPLSLNEGLASCKEWEGVYEKISQAGRIPASASASGAEEPGGSPNPSPR